LDQEVVSWLRSSRAKGSESRDRAIDELGIQASHILIPESEAGELSGFEVLDEDVAVAGEAEEDFPPPRVFEIDSDGSFISITGDEIRRQSVRGERRSPMAGIISSFGSFDFHDVGAEIA